jgi:hypothetical protein
MPCLEKMKLMLLGGSPVESHELVAFIKSVWDIAVPTSNTITWWSWVARGGKVAAKQPLHRLIFEFNKNYEGLFVYKYPSNYSVSMLFHIFLFLELVKWLYHLQYSKTSYTNCL